MGQALPAAAQTMIGGGHELELRECAYGAEQGNRPLRTQPRAFHAFVSYRDY